MTAGADHATHHWQADDDEVPLLAGGTQRFSFVSEEASTGQRLDAFLAAAVPQISRARIRRSIDGGLATVNGARQLKPSHRVAAGDQIEIDVAEAVEAPQPEPIPLNLLFEDEHLAVVNKSPGMVVHPAKGHWAGTLAAALVHRFNQLSGVGGAVRPGIVHRLDRDTSGVIVVAKTDAAHQSLAQQFHDRTVEKEYLAIVAGCPDRDADRVCEPIGPHPSHRERMALRGDHHESRPAETFFQVLERFPGFALVRAQPKTGRTHQIRIHLAHLRTPVLCDKQYGSRSRITLGELRGITRKKHLSPGAGDDLVLLQRQALHARRLAFAHPATGVAMVVEAPLPADMAGLLEALREAATGR
jgi:23S rRNA pseudouridine1911/1915/1917 synthase